MRRARWLLVAAFALSLVVHAFIAFFLHPPRPTRSQQEARSARVTHIVITRQVVTPAPTPKPAPRRTPGIIAPHVTAALPTAHALAAQPSPASGLPAQPAATSAPAAAAKACATPDAPAGVVAAASPPPIPSGVRAQDVTAIAAVRVQLDATGSVVSAAIAQSTQSPSFDALAMEMARETQYAPARRDCKAVASSYLFRVQFSAW